MKHRDSVDYEQRVRRYENHIFSNEKISPKNKELFSKYLKQYKLNNKMSSVSKMIEIMALLLRYSKDFQKEMHKMDDMIALYENIKSKHTPGYYPTSVTVGQAFGTWLNEGVKPAGFRTIKAPSGKDIMRKNFDAKDMISWEEGLNFKNFSPSIQLTAVFLTQLDAGFRPTEIINLAYGDVEKHGEFVSIKVRDGKTGSRDVVCHRCVPYLLQWMERHPTKRANDPLWVIEVPSNIRRKDTSFEGAEGKSHIYAYSYPALTKRVQKICRETGFKQPVDFYSLRHSSCYNDKLDNLPIEVAAKRHGHSVKYFSEVYGRLDVKDVIKRMKLHYNYAVVEGKVEVKVSHVCSKCEMVSPPGEDFCIKCKTPLTLQTALEQDKTISLRQEVEDLRSQMVKMNTFMNTISTEHPEILETMARVGKKK